MKNSTIKPKEKRCVECGTKFMPFKSTDKTCPNFDCRASWALKMVRKKKAETQKADKKKTRQAKVGLMTADQYRAKYVQPVINEIFRIVDFGKPCIATGNYGKENCGHFFSVGSNRTLAMNGHNLHLQSFESNVFRSGDNLQYRQGLLNRYGVEYLAFVEGLQKTPVLRLSKSEMVSIYQKAKIIRLRLKKEPKTLNSYESIKLRNEINLELGIYPYEFSVFDLPLKKIMC